MDKREAIELLKRERAELSRLKGLHYDNQEFKLWRARVEKIIKYGLDGDDYNTFESVQPLDFLDDIGIENLEQAADYPKKLKDYETALTSIIQKYEMLGIEGEGGKAGEVEKMNKKRLMNFLNEKMQEIYDLGTSPPNNADFPIWCTTIEGFLFKVFGEGSWEYQTFKEAGMLRGMVADEYTQYRRALKERENALVSIIHTHEAFGEEELPEPKDAVRSPIILFDAMQFHPKIVNASRALFEDGHYAQAIFEAYKAVNNFVKEKTNLALDGKSLMSKVFSEDAPVIKVNELLTQSDRDEQEGFKFLFMGAMVGIRNPKAHDNVIQTDPYRTLDYLGFASLLMRRVEEGKVVTLKKNV